jgi:hypothetical protein
MSEVPFRGHAKQRHEEALAVPLLRSVHGRQCLCDSVRGMRLNLATRSRKGPSDSSRELTLVLFFKEVIFPH